MGLFSPWGRWNLIKEDRCSRNRFPSPAHKHSESTFQVSRNENANVSEEANVHFPLHHVRAVTLWALSVSVRGPQLNPLQGLWSWRREALGCSSMHCIWIRHCPWFSVRQHLWCSSLFSTLYFFKKDFWCVPLLRSFLNLLQYCFCFMFLISWPQGIWDLSSPTRDQTHALYIGRFILNPRTTREVPTQYDLKMDGDSLPLFCIGFYILESILHGGGCLETKLKGDTNSGRGSFRLL